MMLLLGGLVRAVLILVILAFVFGTIAILMTKDRDEGRYDQDRCPADDRGRHD